MPINDTAITRLATYLLISLVVVFLTSPSLTAFIETLIYLLFIVSAELRRRFVATLRQPIVIGALLLFVFILLSSLWSPANSDVVIEKMTSWKKILLIPIAISLMQTAKLKNRFLLVFVFAMGVFALISWGAYLFSSAPETRELANGLLRNHITQGMAFFVATFATTVLLLQQDWGGRVLKIALWITLFVLLSNCLVVVTARSGYVVGVVLIGCFGAYVGKKRVAILLAVILLGLVAIAPSINEKIQVTLNEINTTEHMTSGGVRLVFWKSAVPVALSAPLYGYGLAGFATEYAKQVADVSGWQGTITHDPHNQYLLILSEQGIIGLLIFFVFIVSCLRQLPPDKRHRFLALSVLAAWLATSLFNGHFSSSVEGRFILLWCGVLLAMPLSGMREKI